MLSGNNRVLAIDSGRFGGTITIESANFINQGTLAASNGETLNLRGTFTNTATITSTGATLNLGSDSRSWNNTGTIDVTQSTVNLGGSLTQMNLGTLNRTDSRINLVGTLTGDLLLNASTGSWYLQGGG